MQLEVVDEENQLRKMHLSRLLGIESVENGRGHRSQDAINLQSKDRLRPVASVHRHLVKSLQHVHVHALIRLHQRLVGVQSALHDAVVRVLPFVVVPGLVHLQVHAPIQEAQGTEIDVIPVCLALLRDRGAGVGVGAKAIPTAQVAGTVPILEIIHQDLVQDLVEVHVHVHAPVRVPILHQDATKDEVEAAGTVVLRGVAECVEDTKGDIKEECPRLQNRVVDDVVHVHQVLELVDERLRLVAEIAQ